MKQQNVTINKYYDFINMYNLIIKHCANKNRLCEIKLYYLEGNLYFKVIDKLSKEIIHNDSISCDEEESTLIINMITSEFVLNHQVRYAVYEPMQSEDIQQFNRLTNGTYPIGYEELNYTYDDKPMIIHRLENSIFSLRIYHYKGIDERTEQLHKMALDKAYSDTIKSNNLDGYQLIKK